MQAIETKQYTDKNGNIKISAFCKSKRRSWFREHLYNQLRRRLLRTADFSENSKEDWRSSLIDSQNAQSLAAELLAAELEWRGPKYGRMVKGWLKNGNCVFVFTGDEE